MTTRTANEHGYVFPVAVLNVDGSPKRPGPGNPNAKPQPTGSPIPPLTHGDKRMENRK